MKTCPKCNTQYADDTLSFCLNDGTPLTGTSVDSPTVVLNESETVVRSNDSWQQSQPTRFVPQNYPTPQGTPANQIPPSNSGGGKVFIAIAATAIGVLAVVGIVVAAGYLFYRSSGPEVATNIANTNASPKPTAANSSPTPTATQTATPTPPVTKPSPSPAATPATTSIDGTPTSFTSKRLSFPRGAYATNVSDTLGVGEQRTYLVACRNGQTMNTKVERGLPCVTYSNGGSALRWTTFAGDNKVTIKNNCDSPSPFVVSVSVF